MKLFIIAKKTIYFLVNVVGSYLNLL
jgi:hypothetical protein